jgi:hypothetical protein
MRSLAVVTIGVDAEHIFEMAAVEDQQPVETFAADHSDKAFAIAFAFGERTGAFTIRMRSLPKIRRRSRCTCYRGRG